MKPALSKRIHGLSTRRLFPPVWCASLQDFASCVRTVCKLLPVLVRIQKIIAIFRNIPLSLETMQVIIPRLWGFDFGLGIGTLFCVGDQQKSACEPLFQNPIRTLRGQRT